MQRQFAIIAVVAVVFGSTFVSARAAAVEPTRVQIDAKRFAFEPSVVTLKKGEPVVLVLKSEDVAHGIRIRELGVDVKAPKGGVGEVQFTPQKTGSFVGHCSVFCGVGHGSMTITFRVVE